MEKKILEIALSYLGEKEIPQNYGFKNPEFEAKMREVGFRRGYAWCMLFCKLVYKEAYSSEIFHKVKDELVPGCVSSYRNANLSKTLKVSRKPISGGIAIFQNVKNPTSGHAAIVEEVIDDVSFNTIEGNTNAAGSREGDVVAQKKRTTGTNGSLKYLGTIYI